MTNEQPSEGKKEYLVSKMLTGILKRWIGDTSPLPKGKSGKLSLLPVSTGSGKTHTVTEIMGMCSLDDENPRMVYVVHTRDNVREAYEKLCKITPDAKEKTLLLKQDSEMMMDYFARVKEDEKIEIPEIKEYKEYIHLKSSALFALSYEHKDNDELMQQVHATVNDAKKALQRRLSQEYKKMPPSQKEQFKYAIEPLFPAVNIEKYRSVFMTTKKFLYPVWTLSGYTRIYDMEIFKGAVLFIDEFDAQNNVLLDHFAEDATKYAINKLQFFVNARHTLKETKFLHKYGIDKEHTNAIIQRFDQVFYDYFNQYNFVYIDRQEEDEKFIIRSETIGTFENTKRGKLTIYCDKQNEINRIEYGDKASFSEMLNAIDGAIRMLSGLGRRVIGVERSKWVQKRENGEAGWVDWITVTEDVLHEFIGEFNLSPQESKYIYFKNIILSRMEERNYPVLPSWAEEFYTNGLSMVRMESRGENAKRSDFDFYSLLHTPESFLIQVASSMHIIGISATANMETVVRNFDIEYLREKLLVQQPGYDEIEELNRLYIEENRQHNRKFHVSFLDDSIDTKWFGNDSIAVRQAERIISQYESDFERTRIIRLLHMYWEYITNDSIQSFLVLRGKYPTEKEQSDMQTLFALMISSNEKTGVLKNTLSRYLETNSVDPESSLFYIAETKNKGMTKFRNEIIKDKLCKGEDAFVIGVYAAIGAGINIDYQINGRKKDFDAIYCELPRNLLVRYPDKDNPIKSFLMLLYQIHALYVSQAIEKNTMFEYLKYAVSGGERWKSIKYNSGQDYTNAAMSFLIQAIGRLHRVNNPDDPMFIYLDEEIRSVIENFDTRGHVLLPSVMEVIKESRVSKNEEKGFYAPDFCKTVEKKSAHMAQKIKHLVTSFYSEKSRNKYIELRTQMLSSPTIKNLESVYQGLYTPLLDRPEKKYWYRVLDGDYDSVECRLAKGDGWIEVSEESANLPLLMRIPGLKEYFNENGYATAFEYGHLPTPVVFNNLYKGILGETVGAFIFEHYCGVALQEIEDKESFYEFFDFVSPNGTAIDFKYYSRKRLEETPELELRKKAVAKREKMGIKKALIVNILYHGGVDRVSRKIEFEDGVAVVPFLINAEDERFPVVDMDIVAQLTEILR